MPYILYFIILTFSPFVAFGEGVALLQSYEEKAIREVLADEVPELSIDTIALISTGWDNLVAEINEEWIFRFPRSEALIQTFKREQLLLERLQKCVLVPVPHYLYHGSQIVFVGYRKLQGESLNEKLYLSCTPEERESLANSLALFLTQFHSAVSPEEAAEWGYQKYQIPLQQIKQNLCGTLPSSDIERLVVEALAYTEMRGPFEAKLVLLHNDLHGENLAFNPRTKQLTGVFDFSDAAIGDCAVEFGKLFTIHPDLVIRTTKAYANLNNINDPLPSAAADFILRRALYILHCRESNNNTRETQLIQMLERFIPTWDQIQGNTLRTN